MAKTPFFEAKKLLDAGDISEEILIEAIKQGLVASGPGQFRYRKDPETGELVRLRPRKERERTYASEEQEKFDKDYKRLYETLNKLINESPAAQKFLTDWGQEYTVDKIKVPIFFRVTIPNKTIIMRGMAGKGFSPMGRKRIEGNGKPPLPIVVSPPPFLDQSVPKAPPPEAAAKARVKEELVEDVTYELIDVDEPTPDPIEMPPTEEQTVTPLHTGPPSPRGYR